MHPPRSYLVHPLRTLRLALLLLPLSAFSLAAAPPPTGTIRGVVVDANGTPIAGAQISAGSASSVTDKGGLFSLKVPPGRYDVVGSRKKGSASDRVAGVEVKAGSVKDVALVIAAP